MKVHLKDRLLFGFISCTYWVHVLSQHGFPPGVPPPSGMPPQQYQHNQQQQYQHHQQQPPQYQQQPPQQMQYQQHPNMNQGQFQQPPQLMQQQYHPPPGMQQQQQHHQGQQQHHQGQQQHHQGQQQQHHQGQQQQQQHHQGGHAHQPHDFKRESHDREHIADHLRDVVNKPVEQMTEEEMEFHYFKLHDYDNNNKLDGTEITKALTHFEREGHQDPNQPVRTLSDDEIAEIVDAVLKEDDLNGDGYVEYSEFVVAQRKARANVPKAPSHQPQGGQH